jgi:glucosamine--fructose-6-phosphate aminotransferase (isomerizing)
LIDDEMPVVVLATKGGPYDKIISNIQEVKARKGRIIAIVSEGDKVIRDLAEFVIEIPETEEPADAFAFSYPPSIISVSYCSVAWLQCRSAKKPCEECDGGISNLI